MAVAVKSVIRENPENIGTEFMLVLIKDRHYANIDSKILAYEDFKRRFASDNYAQYIDARISELKNKKFIKEGAVND